MMEILAQSGASCVCIWHETNGAGLALVLVDEGTKLWLRVVVLREMLAKWTLKSGVRKGRRTMQIQRAKRVRIRRGVL